MKKSLPSLLILIISTFLLCLHTNSFSQSTNNTYKKTEGKQLIFIDSVNVSYDELLEYNPEDIVSITVQSKEDATEAYGEYGIDGAVFMETKQYVFHQSLLKLSKWNKAIISIMENHSADEIGFFINKKNLGEDALYELAGLDWNSIKEVEITRHEELKSIYKVENKKVGILIFTKEN